MVKMLKKRFAPLAVIAMFMASSFLAPYTQVSRGEEQPITVREAIGNNPGSALVEGDVVGHTVSKGSYHRPI